MPTDTSQLNYAREWFEQCQYRVERIQETTFRRADFRVFDDHESYVVEITHKEPGSSFRGLWETATKEAGAFLKGDQSNGFALLDRVIGEFDNNLSGKLNSKAKQLRQTPSSAAETFYITVFFLEEDDHYLFEQFRATLYGSKEVFQFDGKIEPKTCFYCQESSFFRNKDLNGVVFISPAGFQLCVNDLARLYQEFRRTRLYRLFNDQGSLVDPSILEAKEQAFVIRGAVNRKDWQEIWKYVMLNYKVPIAPMRRVQRTGAMAVPLAAIEQSNSVDSMES